MINLKQELLGYCPIKLSSLAEDGSVVPDDVKTSVVLYNKALEALKTGSEDIAIIELRKAIALKPNFYQAMNLLGICYSYINENIKAAEMFEKVIAADNSSLKASEYINLLYSDAISQKPGDQKTRKKVQKDKPQMPQKSKPQKPQKQSEFSFNSRINEILKSSNSSGGGLIKYAALMIVGALVMFLIVAFVKPSFLFGSNDVSSNVSGKNVKEADLISLQNKNADLTSKYNDLQKQLKSAASQIDYYKNVAELNDIENQITKYNYESAAEMLALIKTTKFKGADKDKFNKLYAQAMPRAAQNAWNEGLSLLSAKSFAQAKDKLNKAKLYGYYDMAGVLYELGKCYVGLNDTKNAKSTFNKVIKNYPTSSYAYWASRALTYIK